MRDIGVLKERIEYAERHLQAAHSARERESEALMAMWAQIRDRFEAQETEIARFREEVETLTRVNDELSTLVDQLIATVEGTVEMGKNETVPEVARLADDLLRSEPEKAAPMAPESAPTAAAADDPLSLDGMETDDPLDLGTPLDEPAEDDGESFGDMLNKAMEDDDIDMPEPVMDESASVGIRDLIARIEGSVGNDADEDASDDDLSRELREIENLRNQLSGLHNKISKTG